MKHSLELLLFNPYSMSSSHFVAAICRHAILFHGKVPVGLEAAASAIFSRLWFGSWQNRMKAPTLIPLVMSSSMSVPWRLSTPTSEEW